MMRALRPLAALMLLVLCACAPQTRLPQISTAAVDEEGRHQQDLVFKEHLARLDRLDRVAWAIRSGNVELCGKNTAYRLGMTLADLDGVSKEMREAARRNAGLRSKPTVYQLAEGGVAHAAGLRRGDVVVSVDGEEISTKKQGNKALDRVREAERKGAPFVIVVERGGMPLEFTLSPRLVCSYETVLVNDPEVNAYADGKRIVMNTGMLKFVRSDDELAAILGHELAHNTQGHITAKQSNALLGMLLLDLPVALLTGSNPNVGGQLGLMVYSQEFEFEADYVGLYYTHRGGYDIQNVAGLWRRMSLDNPGAITMGTTHPSNASRFVALEAAREEIRAKQAGGLELRPEMKQAK